MQEKIIDFLKKTDGYLSGEEISQNLHISRAAIWKYIEGLRQDGYDIIAVPHLGYKLVGSPDKLFPSEIQFELKTKILGKKIVYYDTINSTMDVAFNLGIEGAPEGTVVLDAGFILVDLTTSQVIEAHGPHGLTSATAFDQICSIMA